MSLEHAANILIFLVDEVVEPLAVLSKKLDFLETIEVDHITHQSGL